MARRPIPSEVRAAALRRLALVGPTKLKAVAKECGVSPSTLREWWKEEKASVPSAAPTPVPADAPPAGSPPAGPAIKPAAGTAAAAAEAEAARQGVVPAAAPAAGPAPAAIVDGGPQLMALVEGVNMMACRGCAVALGVPWTEELAARAELTQKDKDGMAANASAAATVLLPLLRDATKISCALFLGNFGLCLMGRVAFIRAQAPKKAPKLVQQQQHQNGEQAPPPAPRPATRVIETMP